MSERFREDARRLAGLAARILGWPPHWFWRSTPDEFTAIFESPDDPSVGMTRAELDRLMKDNTDG